MEFKQITLDSFLEVERRHGINLISEDVREEYTEARNKFRVFYFETYAPFIEIYKKKNQPSEAQVRRFNELNAHLNLLNVIIEKEKVMYNFNLMKLLIDDLDVDRLTHADIIKFGEHFEKCSKQYFWPKKSKTEEDGEKKKLKASSGSTRSLRSKVSRRLKSITRLLD